MSGRIKILLFFVVLLVPGLLAAATARIAFTRAESVAFCSSCHTMDPWVANVTGPDSDSLASDHYKRRWIQHDQCYTCHTNYGFLGPLKAKLKGVRHVIAFYVGHHGPIKLYEPFPNENCLECHAEAKGFREDPNHEPLEDILSGKDRCVECHEQVHGVEQEGDDSAAAGEEKAGADEGKDGEKKAAANDEDEGAEK